MKHNNIEPPTITVDIFDYVTINGRISKKLCQKVFVDKIEKLQAEIEILKFERVPIEIFKEIEEKMLYYKQKHHEYADLCNDWSVRYEKLKESIKC